MTEPHRHPDYQPLPPAVETDPEAVAQTAYYVAMSIRTGGPVLPWRELDEWERETWRRLVRDE